MSKKFTRPKAKRAHPRARRPASRQLVLLDRQRFTHERNNDSGSVDREDPHGHVHLTGFAPAQFHVNAMLESNSPWLWIGIDADPQGLDAARRCFAVIGGETLRQLAIGILQFYPDGGRKGGVR
jgi:hypothetical protein